MIKTHSHRIGRQGGFTLLELLLSVGLLAMLLAGMYQIFDSWSQRAVNRTAAADMLRVQNAAQDYADANFDLLRVSPPNVFYEIPISDLTAAHYLPTGFAARNAFRQSIRIFRRNFDVPRLNSDGSVAANSYIVMEIMAVSDNPSSGTVRIPNKRLVDTAQAGGPKLGVISNMVIAGNTYSGLVTSLYNEWSVNRADLAAAGYTGAPDTNGGYLAAYGRVSHEDAQANPQWLYRVPIAGHPEYNRMETDLFMGGERIENAGTIIADNVTATGNAAFRGMGQGTSSETAQAMTVEQALLVSGSGESRINMKDTAGACTFSGGANRTLAGGGCTIKGGEVQVIAGDNDANLTIAGNLTTDGSMITDYTAAGGTVDSRGISTFTNLTTQTMSATKTVVAPTVTVNGNSIATGQLQTANMTLTGGGLTVGNQLVAARVSPRGRNFTANALRVGNSATFTGSLAANGATSSDSLYIGTTSGSFNDTAPNRTIVCRPYNGLTYCEPDGVFTWSNGQTDTCTALANGYRCTRASGGSCTYTRAAGTPARHTVTCP